MGPDSPECDFRPRGSAGNRRRLGDRQAKSSGGAGVRFFELRSADAQQRLLNDTVKAFDEALQLTTRRIRRRRRAEVGRGSSANSTGNDASTSHRCRRAAGGIRTCHRRPDRNPPPQSSACLRRRWISSRPLSRQVSPQSFWSDGRTSLPRNGGSPRQTNRSASPRRHTFQRLRSMLCSASKAARSEVSGVGKAFCGRSEVPWRKRFSMAGGAEATSRGSARQL